jgi:membrane protease YdiL (CAAX protease family)
VTSRTNFLCNYITSKQSFRRYLWLAIAVITAITAVALLNYWIPAAVSHKVDYRAAWHIRVLFAFGLVLSTLMWPKLRIPFPLRFRWSWVSLVPGLAVIGNLSYVISSSFRSLTIPAGFTLLQNAVAVGILEEFLFRGLPFAKNQVLNPKLAVISSTIGFSAVHLAGLTTGTRLEFVAASMVTAIPLGVLLGIIRLATEGVVWPALCHTLVDFSGALAIRGSSRPGTIPSIVFVVLCLSAALLFFRHPVMNPARKGVTEEKEAKGSGLGSGLEF